MWYTPWNYQLAPQKWWFPIGILLFQGVIFRGENVSCREGRYLFVLIPSVSRMALDGHLRIWTTNPGVLRLGFYYPGKVKVWNKAMKQGFRQLTIQEYPVELVKMYPNSVVLTCDAIFQSNTRWWFQIFFIFFPVWGRFPFWQIFFKGVGSTTNQNRWTTLFKFWHDCGKIIVLFEQRGRTIIVWLLSCLF